MRRRVLLLGLLAVLLVAGMAGAVTPAEITLARAPIEIAAAAPTAEAGGTPQTTTLVPTGAAPSVSGGPIPMAPAPPAPLTAEQRLAIVQQVMREQGIDFRASVSLGDDGRVRVSVVPVDLTR